jgi:16S rRNA (adenine1518-N6/adenine1519-N6)-dimethyltransferase
LKNPPVRKSLGQHFLNDRRILERIADALDLHGTETVIEIGPGRGGLTDVLAEKAGRLVAVEIDRALAAQLRQRFAPRDSVSIVEADVLDVNLGELASGPFRLVGNVPYYITTPILFHALEPPRPDRAVYLVQREVADRIVASPGSKEYGALSVNVQSVAVPRILFRVAPGSFQPPPKVESAVVRIDPRPHPAIAPDEETEFRRFVQDVFGMRRKQLQRILRTLWSASSEVVDAALAASGIEPSARPETLSVEQFAAVFRRWRWAMGDGRSAMETP